MPSASIQNRPEPEMTTTELASIWSRLGPEQRADLARLAERIKAEQAGETR